jgi:hypothetical protein
MSGGEKHCPDCAEAVKVEAAVCRYCGYRFDGANTSEAAHPEGTTVLVLGIVGLVACQVVAPFAWVRGSRVLAEMDAAGHSWNNRGNVVAGRVLGIVGSVILALATVGVILGVAGLVLGSSSDASGSGVDGDGVESMCQEWERLLDWAGSNPSQPPFDGKRWTAADFDLAATAKEQVLGALEASTGQGEVEDELSSFIKGTEDSITTMRGAAAEAEAAGGRGWMSEFSGDTGAVGDFVASECGVDLPPWVVPGVQYLGY